MQICILVLSLPRKLSVVVHVFQCSVLDNHLLPPLHDVATLFQKEEEIVDLSEWIMLCLLQRKLDADNAVANNVY